jgi:hypothetical protein
MLLEQLTLAQLFKNFHIRYLSLTFNAAYTKARQWCYCGATLI